MKMCFHCTNFRRCTNQCVSHDVIFRIMMMLDLGIPTEEIANTVDLEPYKVKPLAFTEALAKYHPQCNAHRTGAYVFDGESHLAC